jgi:N-acetylmuramoyl-L-alanine amidase
LHQGRLWLARIDAEALLGPLLRPGDYAASRREVRTVMIDAGHGGRDTGTRNARLKLDEKGPALDVALRLGALLESEGLRVLYTRTDDSFVSLADRAALTNAAQPDLFVSVHFNAVADAPKVRGTETYILTPAGQRSTASPRLEPGDSVAQAGNAFDAWNAQLGWHLHHRLLVHLDSFDRGLKRARFAVLRLVECPAVLVEAAYLSNDEEAELIATPEYRQRVAEAIAIGIAHYAAAVSAAGVGSRSR